MTRKSKAIGFLKTPKYIGGKTALAKFIRENLKYPEEALRNKVEGSVELEYLVNGIGDIKEVKVIHGIGSGCDAEAIRLVKSLVYEKAINRGLKTLTKKKISIHFKLPRAKKPSINYQVVPEKEKKAPQKTSTWSYTINIKK